jgi:hypothetical protein
MLQDHALRKTVVPTGTTFPSYENSLTVDLGSEVRATVKYLFKISIVGSRKGYDSTTSDTP